MPRVKALSRSFCSFLHTRGEITAWTSSHAIFCFVISRARDTPHFREATLIKTELFSWIPGCEGTGCMSCGRFQSVRRNFLFFRSRQPWYLSGTTYMAQQASRASSQVFVSSQLSLLRSQEGSHMFTFYSSNSKLGTATIMKYQAFYPQSRPRLSEKR